MLDVVVLFLMIRGTPRSTLTYTLFPCTTLFRSGGAGAGSESTEPRPWPFRFGERGAGAPVVPPVAAATTGKARPWAAHSLVRGRRGREPPRLSRTMRTRAPGAWREG